MLEQPLDAVLERGGRARATRARALHREVHHPVAETAVISSFPKFPRYPGLNEKSAAEIKALVLLGKVNGSNEWRLDDEMSIQGGLTYLDTVRRYWYAPENFSIVQNSFRSFSLEWYTASNFSSNLENLCSKFGSIKKLLGC